MILAICGLTTINLVAGLQPYFANMAARGSSVFAPITNRKSMVWAGGLGNIYVKYCALCPRHTVPKWLRDGYTKSKMQNSVLYRTMPYYHLVSSLHLRALSGAPCMHFVVRKYSLVCQRICQNNHGVASTCYLLATSVFFV